MLQTWRGSAARASLRGLGNRLVRYSHHVAKPYMYSPVATRVGIFWDFENCAAPSGASGHTLVSNIRQTVQDLGLGGIHTFKAYYDAGELRNDKLFSELQLSGVSLINTPHSGSKNVADQMMLTDFLLYSQESSPDATSIVLISGDRDFSYAVSTLRNRGYQVVIFAPTKTHVSILAQASASVAWNTVISKNMVGIQATTPTTVPTISSGLQLFETESATQSLASSSREISQSEALLPSPLVEAPHPQITAPPISSTESATSSCIIDTSSSQIQPETSSSASQIPAFSPHEPAEEKPQSSVRPSTPAKSETITTSKSMKEHPSLPTRPASANAVLMSVPLTPPASLPVTTRTIPSPTREILAPHFKPLVEALKKLRLAGERRPLRTSLGGRLGRAPYQRAKATSFVQYVELARKEGIVTIGGTGHYAWVELDASLRE